MKRVALSSSRVHLGHVAGRVGKRGRWYAGGLLVLLLVIALARLVLVDAADAETEGRAARHASGVRSTPAERPVWVPAPAVGTPERVSGVAPPALAEAADGEPPEATADHGPTRRVAGRIIRQATGGDFGWLGLTMRWLTSSDDPHDHARVAAYRREQRVAGPGGEFAFDAVPTCVDAFSVNWGRFGREPQVFEFPPGTEDVLEYIAVLDSGWTIVARVMDASGEPIDEFQHELRGRLQRDERKAASGHPGSDETGLIVHHDIRHDFVDEVCHLFVDAPGFVPRELVVPVPPRPSVVRVAVTLERAGAIEGRVTDAVGQADPHLEEVLLAFAQGPDASLDVLPMIEPVYIEGDGSFRMQGVPPGRWVLVARGWGSTSAWQPDVVVTADATTWVDFVVGGAAAVEGQVVDATGAPVVNHELYMLQVIPDDWQFIGSDPPLSWDPLETRSPSTLLVLGGPDEPGPSRVRLEAVTASDEVGHFAFERLLPGPKVLDVGARARSWVRPARLQLDLAEGERRGGLSFVVGMGPELEGIVLNAYGTGLEGADVTLNRVGGHPLDGLTTGPDGRFRFGELPAEALLLAVRHEDYHDHEATVMPGDVTQRVQMIHLPVIAAQVFGGRSVLTEFEVSCDLSGIERGRISIAPHDALFRIRVEQPGTYEVTVSADGYRTETFSLTPGLSSVRLQPDDG